MNEVAVRIEIPVTGPNVYQVQIGEDLLRGSGQWARSSLDRKTGRVSIVSNTTVFPIYGETVARSVEAAGFKVSTFLMKDGERYKDLSSFGSCLASLSKHGIGRSDAVIALGGGVVGDLAGFAAAAHLRGIQFLQIPTTLLAMVDSSVGGKTGINSKSGKNLVGAFHQPAGVLIDAMVLETLPKREVAAGLFEMTKHAALSGAELLSKTSAYLEHRSNEKLADLIARNIAFKARIVTADPKEDPTNQSASSRKILNLGHTLAHALEKITGYRRLRHGEAVGYGLLFATELSKMLDFLDRKSVNLLNDVVRSVGPLPSLHDIDHKAVLEAFDFDKKRIGGSVQFILLKGIGKPVIVSSSSIPLPTIKRALRAVLR